MSEAEHVEYFRRRAAAERELAETAPDTKISKLHSDMAAYYDTLIRHPERRHELNIVIDHGGPETRST